MIVAGAVIAWGVLAILALLNPRVGAVLIWFAIWLYPNTALQGLLPLSVRLDDLWVIFVFLVCLFSPAARRATTPLFWLACVWSLSIMLGNWAGMLYTGGYGWEQMLKPMGKALYIPCITFILSSLLHSEDHLRRHLRGLCLAACAAGLLGIAMVHLPSQLQAFVIPRYFEGVDQTAQERRDLLGETLESRAAGAVGIVSLATISECVGLLGLALMLNHPRWSGRAFFGLLSGFCVVTLAYTSTRSAIGGLVAALVWAIIFTRHRSVLIPLVAAGVAALVLQGDVLSRVMRRITGEGGEAGMPIVEGMTNRLALLQDFVEHITPVHFLVGTGMTATFIERAATVHNTYLGALVYGGVFGVVVLVLLIVTGVKLGRRALAVQRDWLARALGLYLLMVTIALMVQGLAGEVFQQTMGTALYFAAMVFVERRLAQLDEATPRPWSPVQLAPSPVVMSGPYVSPS